MTSEQQERHKRFDQRFIHGKKIDKNTTEYELTTPDNLKSFLDEEIALAVANREKEMVGIIKNTPIEYVGNSAKTIEQILSLISKNK